MLYVLNLRSPRGLGDFGLGTVRVSILFPAFLTFLMIFGISTSLGMFAELVGRVSSVDLRNPALPGVMPEDFSIFQPPFLPLLILFTSGVIAYFEELFFRVYLVGQFSDSPRGSHLAVLVSSLLFAGGHLYQGLIGGIGTFFIGLLLGYRYLRCRNWHEISIAHALYNFTVLLLIPL
jgi:membrane protease YdiL (CAAX protease family)